MSLSRVPTLSNSQVEIRIAENPFEVETANRLVFRNYVEDGFWEDDATQLRTNKFLHTPARTIFVAIENGILMGTMSIIKDSLAGLPSDGTQHALMRQLRSTGAGLAEVSAFAMDRSRTSHRRLVYFLMSYVMQYSFYYAAVDQLVASCKPEHANFYESVLCFSKVSDLTYYDYSHAAGYLISLDLVKAHRLFSEKYPGDPNTGQSVYRFFLRDTHPCHRYPPVPPLRERDHDWVDVARKVA